MGNHDGPIERAPGEQRTKKNRRKKSARRWWRREPGVLISAAFGAAVTLVATLTITFVTADLDRQASQRDFTRTERQVAYSAFLDAMYTLESAITAVAFDYAIFGDQATASPDVNPVGGIGLAEANDSLTSAFSRLILVGSPETVAFAQTAVHRHNQGRVAAEYAISLRRVTTPYQDGQLHHLTDDDFDYLVQISECLAIESRVPFAQIVRVELEVGSIEAVVREDCDDLEWSDLVGRWKES